MRRRGRMQTSSLQHQRYFSSFIPGAASTPATPAGPSTSTGTSRRRRIVSSDDDDQPAQQTRTTNEFTAHTDEDAAAMHNSLEPAHAETSLRERRQRRTRTTPDCGSKKMQQHHMTG